jgi:hypothetical protein
LNLLNWRAIFFINFLGLALLGNAVMPGLGSVAGWLTIWAVLGLRYGLSFMGLSAGLDPRTWIALYGEYESFIQPMFSWVGTVRQMVKTGASAQQLQQFVQSSVPIQVGSPALLDGVLFVIIPLEIGVLAFAIWKLRNRMKKIRRMTRAVWSRLPAKR